MRNGLKSQTAYPHAPSFQVPQRPDALAELFAIVAGTAETNAFLKETWAKSFEQQPDGCPGKGTVLIDDPLPAQEPNRVSFVVVGPCDLLQLEQTLAAWVVAFFQQSEEPLLTVVDGATGAPDLGSYPLLGQVPLHVFVARAADTIGMTWVADPTFLDLPSLVGLAFQLTHGCDNLAYALKQPSLAAYREWREQVWTGPAHAAGVWFEDGSRRWALRGPIPVDKVAIGGTALPQQQWSFEVPPPVLAHLVAWADHLGEPLDRCLLGVWLAVAARVMDHAELEVACRWDMRPSAWAHALGPFSEPIDLTVSLRPHGTFPSLLEALALVHSKATLTAFCPRRGRHVPALGFGFLAIPRSPLKNNDTRDWAIDVAAMGSDLDVNWVWAEGRLTGVVRYDGSRFEASRIETLGDALCQFMAHVDGTTSLNRIPLGTALTQPFTEVGAGPEWEMDVFRLFEARALAQPNAIALHTVQDPVLGSLAVEYGMLLDWARRTAAYLHLEGVGPGSRVGVFLHGSADSVALMLAVLACGAAFVPLDPDCPRDRLATLIRKSKLGWLVTRSVFRERLPASMPGLKVLCSDEGDGLSSEQTVALGGPWPADHIAWIMFSSGSTGAPKGVATPHRAICHLIGGLEGLALGPGKVVLQTCSLALDASVVEVWGTLLRGGTLVLPGPQRVDSLAPLIGRFKITTVWLSSFVFRSMVIDHLETLAGLEQVMSGGDVVSPLHVARFLEHCPRTGLINAYATTETAGWATFCDLRQRGLSPYAAPIGTAIAHTQVALLGSNLEPVPQGWLGEMCVTGACLPHGYWGDPRATAERFLPNPFSGRQNPGLRLYRTGDRARWLPDGQLEFWGRLDQLVKVQGFLVDPAQIKEMLEGHPRVQEAWVVSSWDGSGNRHLVACVGVGHEQPLDDETRMGIQAELRSYLGQFLPKVLIPATMILRDSLPLTPSGTLDLETLPHPVLEPINPAAEMVHGWAMSLRGNEAMYLRQAHSPRGMANAWVDGLPLDGGWATATPMVPLSAAESFVLSTHPLDRVPLSVEQAYALALGKNPHAGSGGVNHLSLQVHTEGRLVVALFEHAWRSLVGDCDGLGTVFGEKHQETRTTWGFELIVVDGSTGEEAFRTCLLNQVRTAFGNRRLEIAQKPAWSMSFVLLNERQGCLLVSGHRAWADEESLFRVVRAWFGRYQELLTGTRETPETELGAYAPYALWQERWLCSDAVHQAQVFWQNQLQGALVNPELPYDFRPNPEGPHAMAFFGFGLPKGLDEAVFTLAEQTGFPPALIYQTAFACVVARYAHLETFVMGLQFANRVNAQLEQMVGPLVTLLPIRVSLVENPSLWHVLHALRAQIRKAKGHSALPFPHLAALAWGSADSSELGPMIPIAFSWDSPLEPIHLPGLTATPSLLTQHTFETELHLRLSETREGLVGSLVYRRDLFLPETMGRLCDSLIQTLHLIIGDPGIRVSELSPIDAQQRETLVRTWNTTHESPKDRCVPRLFEDLASHQPFDEGLHVVSASWGAEEGRYGFSRLETLANTNAAHLVQAGVGPEQAVAVALPLGPAALIATLAVLKAGGIVVPFDPQLPHPEREALLAQWGCRFFIHAVGETPPTALQTFGVAKDGRFPNQGPCLPMDFGDRARPQQTAYWLYAPDQQRTLAITHQTLSHLVWAYRSHLTPGQETLLCVPFHDPEMIHVWLSTWLSAGKLVVPSGGVPQDTPSLFRALAQCRAARLFAPFWRVKHMAMLAARDGYEPKGLKEVVIYGRLGRLSREIRAFLEPLNGEHWYRWEGSGFSLLGLYPVSDIRMAETGPVIPGRPVDNGAVYVLDRYLMPAPAGMLGRVYVSGLGLAQAWAQNAQATAQTWIPNPFRCDQPGSRLCDTGLYARFEVSAQGVPTGIQLQGLGSDRLRRGTHAVSGTFIRELMESQPSVQSIRFNLSPDQASLEVRVLLVPGEPRPERVMAELIGACERFLSPPDKPDRFLLEPSEQEQDPTWQEGIWI